MARRRKSWDTDEWVAFGNRVKRVRREMGLMLLDMQHVVRARQMDGLIKAEMYFDRWRSMMDALAAVDIPGDWETSMFYGDPPAPAEGE